jgi:hypothetical protein
VWRVLQRAVFLDVADGFERGHYLL